MLKTPHSSTFDLRFNKLYRYHRFPPIKVTSSTTTECLLRGPVPVVFIVNLHEFRLLFSLTFRHFPRQSPLTHLSFKFFFHNNNNKSNLPPPPPPPPQQLIIFPSLTGAQLTLELERKRRPSNPVVVVSTRTSHWNKLDTRPRILRPQNFSIQTMSRSSTHIQQYSRHTKLVTTDCHYISNCHHDKHHK